MPIISLLLRVHGCCDDTTKLIRFGYEQWRTLHCFCNIDYPWQISFIEPVNKAGKLYPLPDHRQSRFWNSDASRIWTCLLTLHILSNLLKSLSISKTKIMPRSFILLLPADNPFYVEIVHCSTEMTTPSLQSSLLASFFIHLFSSWALVFGYLLSWFPLSCFQKEPPLLEPSNHLRLCSKFLLDTANLPYIQKSES